VTELAQFSSSWVDGVSVTRVEGEIDLSNVGSFATVLADAAAMSDRMIVDLSAASYIDSSGIAALLGLVGAQEGSVSQVRVVAPEGSHLHRVLQIAQVPRAMPVDATFSQALSKLTQGG
jgi:anti-sigma B factor antagonist